MSHLRALAVTARSITLLLTPPGTKFALPRPVDWALSPAGGGETVARGRADTAPLFVEGLQPDTEYALASDIGTLTFRTSPCAGLIRAEDHGVRPDEADNAGALARAVAAVPPGGTLMLPPGRIVSGPLFLKPDMTLHLPAGTELAAKSARLGWPQLPSHLPDGRDYGTWEGLPERSFAALITARDCTDLAITGAGIIDGGGDRGDWWSWPKETRDGARRPRTVQLSYCARASLTGLTVRNAPSWTIHPHKCRDLTFAGLRVQNPPDSPNTDGLNPESCAAVTIAGLHFSVGDDCIAIKAGKRGGQGDAHLAPTRGVTIEHCLMERGHGAVVLGSEMSGGISEVTIRHCEFRETDRGLRLKTRRGRGGHIRAIHLHDVTMEAVPTPLAANAFYFCDADGKDDWVQSRSPAPVDETTPALEDLTFERVTATGVTLAAAALLGLPEAPITGVRIAEYRLSYDPDATPDVPLMALHVAPALHAGLWAEFAEVEGSIEVYALHEESALC